MENYKNILITGGAGFIGSHLIRALLEKTTSQIYNLDKLNYASDLDSLTDINQHKNRLFTYKLDLKNKSLVDQCVNNSDPDLIIHLAAETHVDRSLDDPFKFIESNIIGTFNILEAALKHFKKLSKNRKETFRFHHVSTDEVFGSLGDKGKFNEHSRYEPRSPYSASKASSDHLVRAWHHSYNLPILITNCSNNFGPYQFPEKLIPLSINKALRGEPIPIYGTGNNIRDWIYVEDHVDGILCVASKGKVGNTYCIGGNCEKTNLDLINVICDLLDNEIKANKPHRKLIRFVKDRPGHDFRYSLNTSFIQNELGWYPKSDIQDALKKTIRWYVNNVEWCNKMLDKSGYKGQRLGSN